MTFIAATIVAAVLLALRVYEPVGLAVSFQCAAMLNMYIRRHAREENTPYVVSAQFLRYGVIFSFACLVGISIVSPLAIYTSANSLERPIWIFFFLSLSVGLIYVQAHLFSAHRIVRDYTILQVVIVAITIIGSSILVFPYNGGDTWAHLWDAQRVLDAGTIQAINGAYQDYPLYPGMIAVISNMAGVGLADAARLFNVFVVVASTLIVYAATRKFYRSHTYGVMAALLLLTGKWFVYWGTYVVSMTATILLFCLLVVALYRRRYHGLTVGDSLTCLAVLAMMPFFHPITSVAIVLLVVAFWVMEGVTSFSTRHRTRSFAVLPAFAITALLFQWAYFGEMMFSRAVLSVADELSSMFVMSGGDAVVVSGYRTPFIYILDQISLYLLVGLAVFEMLWQSQQGMKRISFHATLLGLGFLLIGYGGQFLGLSQLLPHRWLLFGSLILVFPAAAGFLMIFQRPSIGKCFLAFALMFIYSFSSLTNTETNRDHPLYGAEITQRIELTSAEFAGVQFLEALPIGSTTPVRVDFRLYDYFKQRGINNLGYWNDINPDQYQGVFALRSIYTSRYFRVSKSANALNRQKLDAAQFYDSGDLQLLDNRKLAR
jgi:hypothetical protein